MTADMDASSVTRRAADLVSAQRSSKDWSAERQAELDAWLTQSLSHRVAYLRVDAAWKRAERLAALHAPMRQPVNDTQAAPTFWRRIAVAVGVAAVVGLTASRFVQTPGYQLIETPKGGLEKVTLPDGSQIELNTATAVKVSFRQHERYVELLRGEAYFDIRHDAARPFAVTAGNRRVVDLGTKFAIRMSPGDLRVSLLQGKASFESQSISQQKPLILAPGDVVVASADAVRVSRQTIVQLSDSLAWRRGTIVFHYTRLGEAAAELNRYGGPTLVIADAKTANLLISGTFLTNRPDDFAGVAHEIFGVRIDHRNGNLVLSR